MRINDIHGIAQPLGLAKLILNVKQLTRERYSINIKSDIQKLAYCITNAPP